jgi:membrane protease YdiL (CAAX protease family)
VSRAEPLRPLLAAFRGEQFKPTVILLASSVLLVTWSHYGSTTYYLDHLAGRFVLWDDPAATAGVYAMLSTFLLLGVVPALIVKLVFRERLADYGVQLGHRARTVRSFLFFAPVFVLAAYLGSHNEAILAHYPINKSAGNSSGMFGFHACLYALYYAGWEFHFRGFTQFGLQKSMGRTTALCVQVFGSVVAHIGKPMTETYGAIAAGVLWGILAYRTQSLLAGMLQHLLLGLALDWFILYG